MEHTTNKNIYQQTKVILKIIIFAYVNEKITQNQINVLPFNKYLKLMINFISTKKNNFETINPVLYVIIILIYYCISPKIKLRGSFLISMKGFSTWKCSHHLFYNEEKLRNDSNWFFAKTHELKQFRIEFKKARLLWLRQVLVNLLELLFYKCYDFINFSRSIEVFMKLPSTLTIFFCS